MRDNHGSVSVATIFTNSPKTNGKTNIFPKYQYTHMNRLIEYFLQHTKISTRHVTPYNTDSQLENRRGIVSKYN